MNCDESRELILDVVYGEEVDSRACFNFFRHLDECRDCSAEYKEFLSTREMLKDWELDEPAEVPASVPNSAKPWI